MKIANASVPFPLGQVDAEAVSMQLPEEEAAALFHQLRNPLLRYVLSFGLSVQDAEEISQEVFLSLFVHLQHRKSRDNLRGWVFRVGHNLALKRRMRNSRRAGVEQHNIYPDLPDPSPDPEEHLVSSQRRQRLLSIVRALPEQDRCCLVLRGEGLRYREIAGVLGISLGSVALSLGRSLARLDSAGQI